MSYDLFTTIGSILIFSIWAIIAFTGKRKYFRILRMPGDHSSRSSEIS